MRRPFVPAVVSLLCVVGCGSTGSGDPAASGGPGATADPAAPTKGAPDAKAAPQAAPAGPTAEELRDKADDTATQLSLAKVKLERAKMDADQQSIDGAAAVQKATFELAVATKAKDHYANVEMPQKTARAQLDLQQVKDALTEQEEELQQLELMYKKDDLADKTKEIVLARTKRRLERVRQSMALQQKELDDLVGVQQPEQLRKLDATVTDKTGDLRRAEFALRSGQMDKDLAYKTQEAEVNRLIRETDKAKQKAASSAVGSQ